ncbi:hypothetical protein FNV43_RR13648 [Rhamnella rubrinervis]|uniref:Ribosomal RNA-processing protein 7 C-terminal domain-containing protein n=1 Tax=Rhamnella rubrinervis TaxID=2594499 RepID=A0A8K0H1K5_9ROSA|nr:hypothetical protein FNV43_RR13648 [Rhamnella rubrinervis]
MGDKDLQKKKKKTENKKFPMRNMERVEKGRKSNTDMETIKDQPREKTKRKRGREKNVDVDKVVQISTEADTSIKTIKKEKVTKSPRKKKFMSVENSNSLVGQADRLDTEIGNGFSKQNGELKKAWKKRRKVQNSTKEDMKLLEKRGEADWNQVSHVSSADEDCLEGKLKRDKRKKRREHHSSKEAEKSQKEEGGADKGDVYLISSGDEDSSKGMKKWVTEYHQSRQGIEILQQTIDEFLTAHEEKLEKEKEEREAQAAEGGWIVVTHHKGRKKTTDENGVTVGSVAQAVVEDNMAKKKQKEVGLNFYRFQRKEAQRNEIMMLQSKFEQDKKRIQQVRAARKFRPY